EGFVDLVGWITLLQLAREMAKALSALSYCRRQCVVELAVKKELAVLGIEADGLGRQQIDGEIRREPRDVFAVEQCRSVRAMTCHEANARTIATPPDRRCKASSRRHNYVCRLAPAFLNLASLDEPGHLPGRHAHARAHTCGRAALPTNSRWPGRASARP